jgi:hypothetical protein
MPDNDEALHGTDQLVRCVLLTGCLGKRVGAGCNSASSASSIQDDISLSSCRLRDGMPHNAGVATGGDLTARPDGGWNR